MTRALVLGGGYDVWDEVLAFEQLLGRRWNGLVVAANDVGVHWPRDLHHWVTLHPMKMPTWQKRRARYGFTNGYQTWGRQPQHCDRVIVPWPGGSSGLLAVQVALAVGCTHVVLCGVPMTNTAHFPESDEQHILDRAKHWAHADKHWRAWEREVHRMRGLVRSMSGRTQQLLGAPDAVWVSSMQKEEEAASCRT